MESSSADQARDTKKPSRIFYGYIIVACSFIILLVSFGTNYSFGVFFNSLLADLGWSRAVTSSGYSLGIILSGFIGIFGGRLCDKFGPRTIVLVCMVVLALGCFLMSRLTELWQFYLFYGVLIGNGFGVAMVPITSTISRWFIRGRGLMTGIVVAGIGTGIIVMPLLAHGLLSIFDWRRSFIMIGILIVVTAIPACIFLKRDPGKIGLKAHGESDTARTKIGSREIGLTFREAVRTSGFWIVCIVYTLYGVYVQGVVVHIVPYAKSIGINDSAAVLILPCLGLGSIAGRIGMGSMSDRIGVKYTLIVGLIANVSAFIWLWFASDIRMIYLFAFVYGFGYGTLISMQTLAPARLFGLISIGTMAGIVVFVYTIGGTIGPIVTGYIFDVTGSYRLAIIMFGACAAGGLAATLFLRPPKKFKV